MSATGEVDRPRSGGAMPSIWAPAQRALLAPPPPPPTVDNVGLCFRISRHHGCCGGVGELIVIMSAQVRARRVKIIIIAELNY